MSLTPGTRVGVYEVIGLIGVGGMGEVHRARDTRLGRDVALKTLPEAFATDADRLARFEREARVLASLNHPNIAAIYGIEGHALVMELVEGEDLSMHIGRGSIPVADALLIARQIAEALEAAHEQGITHRDLKPANIKVRVDGTVKVLDFGLAKAMEGAGGAGRAAGAGGDVRNSPTITSPAAMTGHGVILGTAAYMSPEQARGKPVDRRADIWAFGCVLFEMLTGRRSFTGETVTDVLAAVVDKEPAWSALPAATPATIQRMLRQCLEKDLKRRLPHIGAARLELDDASVGRSGDAVGTPAQHDGVTRWRWVSTSLGVLALAALALAAYALARPLSREPRAAQRVVVLLPPDVRLTQTSSTSVGQGHDVALSLDDRQFVFLGTSGPVTQLYLRHLDQYAVRPLPGTEHATVPFFSPDGLWVGFQSGGQLRKVALAGAAGIPEVICSLSGEISTAAWGADGEIVFASRAGLSRVAASGGTPEALTTLLPGEVAHAWPQFLPGDRILFTVLTASLGQERQYKTAVLSKTTLERQTVQDEAQGARYLASGHLIFFRTGSLWTVPFNATTGLVTGTAVPRVNDVFILGNGSSSFVTSGGSLLYVPGGMEGVVMWVERDGRTSPLFSERGPYQHPVPSPDGMRVALDIGAVGAKNVWLHDVQRGTRVRLTTGDGTDGVPIWMPDGTSVAYQCDADLCRVSADGAGQPENLLRREYQQVPSSWSPDGRILAYHEAHPQTGWDIWQWRAGQEPAPILATPFNEGGAVFSPDGRFLSYVSDESGRVETYVRPYPKGTEKWLVSTNGGAEPVWSPDGKELFYRENDTMMAVPVSLRPTFTAGIPRRLFDDRYDRSNSHQHYSAGGGRFLKVQRDQDVGPDRLHVILNFVEELNASLPVGR